MSSIIDVLAYNTHLNALIANFALNETFLPTAQLRTSLVNHTLAFGYIPRSKTASNARLTVQVAVTGTQPDTITLPAGTAFTTEVEGVTYTFRTLIDYTGVNNGQGLYTFVDAVGSPYITVFEGDLTVKTFLAEPQADRQVYVVPDENLDLSTVAVQVYDNINSDNFTTYFSANATSGGNVISGFGSKNNSTMSCTSTSQAPVETNLKVNCTPTEVSSTFRLSRSLGPGIYIGSVSVLLGENSPSPELDHT